MIKFDNISKVYNDSDQYALKDINIYIKKGEFVFLVGPSGAGKSTFLRLILKDFNPTYGTLYLNEVDVNKLKNNEIQHLRRRMGVVFQEFKLLEGKTVFENVAFAMEVLKRDSKTIKKRVSYVLEIVGLNGMEDRYPQTMSGGERQRVAIARAIINGPEILICDEPTGNLDPRTSFGIMKLLENINTLGTTIIMATHDKQVVDSFNKRVLILENGVIRGDRQGGYFY
ncbi:MAG: cell division ATP-binding protein FtsE [Eubacteriaceae bacterium]|nr:cell division ATP-binding protein FtsE [Eubacteriaceae bacterium]